MPSDTYLRRNARKERSARDHVVCATCGYIRANVIHETDREHAPEGLDYYADVPFCAFVSTMLWRVTTARDPGQWTQTDEAVAAERDRIKVPAEITATNMIKPPPCGHTHGTHPSSCVWLAASDPDWAFAEIARLLDSLASEQAECDRLRHTIQRVHVAIDAIPEPTYDGKDWGTCEQNGWDRAIVAVLRIVEGETP